MNTRGPHGGAGTLPSMRTRNRYRRTAGIVRAGARSWRARWPWFHTPVAGGCDQAERRRVHHHAAARMALLDTGSGRKSPHQWWAIIGGKSWKPSAWLPMTGPLGA